MPDAVEFIARHSEAIVFLYVFADQIGVPLPAVPALLAMGRSPPPASSISVSPFC